MIVLVSGYWPRFHRVTSAAGCKLLHAGPQGVTMNYLATSGDGQMLCHSMSPLASLTNLGGPDLIVILLIILVLFGAKKLPELARGMGSAIKEFQKAKDDFSSELQSSGKTDVAQTDVQRPAATVPRIENAPSPDVGRSDQARTTGQGGPV